MELDVRVKMNENLYLRDPEQSELGSRIVKHGVRLIHQIGFEEFTFRKLAVEVETTEASIYRYFENKHRLLIYIMAWYWSWLEYKVVFATNNVTSAEEKIDKVIALLSGTLVDEINTNYLDDDLLGEIVMWEGSKVYLTKKVTEDNKAQLFKPYKDLVKRVGSIIKEYSPGYPYPRSLSSTLVEMSHFQHFFMKNLPALTDFGPSNDRSKVHDYLHHLVFSTLGKLSAES